MTDPLLSADGAAQAQPDTPMEESVASCQHQDLHAIEAQVVDKTGVALGGAAVELRKTEDEVLCGKTDRSGWVRFEGLPQGSYELVLPTIDQDAWEIVEVEPLPASQAARAAVFGPPRESEIPPELHHLVQPGECIVQLAFLHGLLPEMLWQYPANEHLRREGRVQEILTPGETVVIPAPRIRPLPAAIDTRLRLQCATAMIEIPLRFFDRFDEPRSHVPYMMRLLVGDDLFDVRAGETDDSGCVHQVAPPDVTTVEVTLGTDADRELYELFVGDLDPLETLRGVQGRLDNLGYPCPLDGKPGEETRAALRAFQEDSDLTVTGEIDDATLSKLEERHGS
jgi:hypothetical protein